MVWAETIEGVYHHDGDIAATLEVSRTPDGYAVELRGGVPQHLGAATPADCAVDAHGALHQGVLGTRFDSIETEDFTYNASQADRERRALQIVFRPDSAEVTEADTSGYCGLGATFLGHYRLTAPRER